MAWSEHLHIHIHDDSETKSLLKQILEAIKKNGGNDDEATKQQILDKLNKAIADIKTTV